MLEVANVTKQFGGLTAIDNVDFTIREDEIVGLIGPNGAGKTTLFNTITGTLDPEPGGVVRFSGQDLTALGTDDIAKLGLIRSFQIVRVFDKMTVLENAGAGALFGSTKSISRSQARDRGYEALEFVGLEEKADVEANTLPIAQKKQLELARAVATEPKLLLLDEIASGLTPGEIDELTDTIRRLRGELGISVMWTEHIMDAIMGVADRIIVLDNGQKIAEGSPAEIRENERVVEAYLGEET
jgi:branched-chain amino acid transport system ATP-binding protein